MMHGGGRSSRPPIRAWHRADVARDIAIRPRRGAGSSPPLRRLAGWAPPRGGRQARQRGTSPRARARQPPPTRYRETRGPRASRGASGIRPSRTPLAAFFDFARARCSQRSARASSPILRRCTIKRVRLFTRATQACRGAGPLPHHGFCILPHRSRTAGRVKHAPLASRGSRGIRADYVQHSQSGRYGQTSAILLTTRDVSGCEAPAGKNQTDPRKRRSFQPQKIHI
jgi:hypothetical protein